MPNMIPVSSSNLSAVGYDGQTMQLFIRFHSGALYVYNNVPQSVYEGLECVSKSINLEKERGNMQLVR